jgi:DNA-binding MarR family transcriptional regulator
VLPELDPVIHAPSRLRLVTLLAGADEPLDFPRLQQLLELTAGNLSTHLRKLEQAGYAEVTKAYRDRTPVTWVELTPTGRHAHATYLAALRRYLDGEGARDLLRDEDGVT